MEMREIASVLKLVLANTEAAVIAKGRSAGQPSKARYPVYPELDLEYLRRAFG